VGADDGCKGNAKTYTIMKATLTYTLPDEEKDHLRAVRSLDLCLFIADFQEYLRGQHKHGDPPDDVGKIYERWFDELSGHGIDLDNLIS